MSDREALIQTLKDLLKDSKSSKSLFREWKHYDLKEQSGAQKYPQEHKCGQILVWNLIFPLVPLV